MKKTNPRLSLPAALLLWLSAASAPAQNTVPVRDINTSFFAPATTAASLVKINNDGKDILILSIDDPLSGHELWKGEVQGTTVNLSVLKDIQTGGDGSIPQQLTPVGDKVFFTAGSGASRGLWVTDGKTSGTNLLLGSAASPSKLLAFKNANNTEHLVFEASSSPEGRELWKSDGSVAGTTRVTNVSGNNILASSYLVDSANSTLYFVGFTPTTSQEIYKINFTNTNGAVLVKDLAINGTPFPGGFDPGLTLMNNKIYFAADTEPELGSDRTELWVTDGIPGGTTEPVAEIAPGGASSTPRSPKVMTVTGTGAGTYLFFTAEDGQGRELWRSNGQTGGGKETVRLRNFRGTDSAFETDTDNPLIYWDQLTVVGNTLFFVANSGNGAELHRSSGRTVESETAQVTDIRTGTPSSDPRNLTPFDNKLVFTATNNSGNTVLYFCTTPTPTAVTIIKDFGASRKVSPFTRIGTQLYFLVDDAELWRTDAATGANTVMIRNFRTGNAGSSAESLTLHGEEVYFSATDGDNTSDDVNSNDDHGQELWKTDGTLGGTLLVKDIRPGTANSNPKDIISVGNKVFFTADTGSNRELWITDGTEAGTQTVLTHRGNADEEINTEGGSKPEELASIDGILYFSAESETATDGSATGREPWRSDGTPAGTQLIANLVGLAAHSDPKEFIKYKDQVYFVAKADSDQRRLRRINTNPTSVEALGDSQDLTDLTLFGSGNAQKIYFAAKNSTGTLTGLELWSSNGTEIGTALVKDINLGSGNANPKELTVAGSYLYFSADNGNAGVELWRSNGSGAGTSLVKDINPGANDSSPHNLTEAGGKVFFIANNGTHGEELWVSDGSAGGTLMLKDIVPGAGNPGIANMKNVDGVLCFTADDGINGREMWISDGTAAGTTMVNDFTGLSATSNPGNFTQFKDQLLYTAADRVYGNELRLFSIGSKIQVEQPLDTILAAGSAVDFASVDFKPVTLNVTIRNVGIASLASIKPLISGINASEFTLVTPKPATTLIQGATTTFGVKFTPKEGGARTATLSIMSSDSGHNPFILQLHGTANKDPYISDHPDSMMRKVGQTAEFEAEATGTAPLTLQWKKGTGSIAGALSIAEASPATTGYQIASVTLKDAGAYSLSVKNGIQTALSNAAELGVVEDYPQDLIIVAGESKVATFKVNAAGNQLTYQWLKDDVPINNDTRITGATTKTMVIKALTAADTNRYTCRVSNPSGSQTGGNTQLNVFTAEPDVADTQLMPDGVIGGDYTYQVAILGGAAKAPLTYSAKNLPPGLKIDAKTGKISGRPTKAGDYPVILTATNTFGSDSSDEQPVNIAALPPGVEGIYTGIVEHNGALNKYLGGRLDLTVTKTGAYSGSLTLGATKLAIKGAVDIFRLDDAENLYPKFHLDIKPAASSGLPATVALDVQIDRDSGLLMSSTVTTAGASAAITGWRNADAVAALHYDGTYNFGLELGAPEQVGAAFADKIPQGWSFGTLKSAKGKVTLAGRTADGDKITGSSFVGVNGKVVVFQTMYTPLKGSLAGSLTIDPKNTSAAPGGPGVADNVITSADDIKWVRPADPKSKTRTYVAGFGMPGTPIETPVSLEASGSIFIKPVGTALVYDLDPNPANGIAVGLDLDFYWGGIPTADPNGIDASVIVNASHKILPGAAVTAGTKLASITGSTGAFTGTFTLTDADPLGGTKPIVRKVTFQGLMIKNDLGTVQGVGFFTLPQLPQTGQTITTSPIFGGSVELIPTGEPALP